MALLVYSFITGGKYLIIVILFRVPPYFDETYLKKRTEEKILLRPSKDFTTTNLLAGFEIFQSVSTASPKIKNIH